MRPLDTFTPATSEEEAAMELSKLLCAEGDALLEQKRYQDALDAFRQDMQLCGEVCGKDHSYFANSLYDMSACYFNMGQADFALIMSRRAHEIHRHACGAEHHLTIRDMWGMGYAMMRVEKHQQALALYEQLLAIVEKQDDASPASLYGYIAEAHFALQQYEQAVSFLRRKLALAEKEHGADAEIIMAIVARLADSYEALQQYEHALPLRQRVLAQRKDKAGEQGSREVVDALRETALCLGPLDKRDTSLAMLDQATEMNRQLYEREVRLAAAGFSSLGEAYSALGDTTNPYKLFKWDVRLRHQLIGTLDEELHMGALDGELERVQSALEYGAAVDGRDRFGRTALIDAARHGHTEIAKLLVEKGADVNVADLRGCTALLETIAFAHREIFESLIEHGADAAVTNHEGRTLLMECCINNPELIGRVLEFGFDLEQRDHKGKTALILAAEWGNLQAVEILLARGACIDTLDKQERTALMHAAGGKISLSDHDYPAIVRRLLQAGVDPTPRDLYDKTALDHAREGDEVQGVRIVQEGVAELIEAALRDRAAG